MITRVAHQFPAVVMYQFIKKATYYWLYRSNILTRYIDSRKNGKALVLTYHNVIPGKTMASLKLMPGVFLSSESFRMQVVWLKDHFNIVSLSEIIQRVRNKTRWNEPLCAITFDDGWKNNYDFAYDIMLKEGIPATIFLVGKYINTSKPFFWDICFDIIKENRNLPSNLTGITEIDNYIRNVSDQDPLVRARNVVHRIRQIPYEDFMQVSACMEKYYHQNLKDHGEWQYETLSIQNIREMQENNISFGYHSTNHYMLTRVPSLHLKEELMPPHNILNENGVKMEPIFCYPDGQFNADVIRELKAMDYIGAVSMIPGYNDVNTSPYILKRVNLHKGNSETTHEFLATIGMKNR